MRPLLASLALLLAAPNALAGGVPVNDSILELPNCSGWKIRCHGNEPFWSIDFLPGNQAVWTEPGLLNNPVQQSYSITSHSGGPVPVSSFSTSNGIEGSISYVPSKDCNDSMADTTFSFRINLTALPIQGGGSVSLSGINAAGPGQQHLCCAILPQ